VAIHPVDGRHVVVVQRDLRGGEVFAQATGVGRFRDDVGATLQRPRQYDLARRETVFARNLQDDGTVQKSGFVVMFDEVRAIP
jgi:hypothetical protein